MSNNTDFAKGTLLGLAVGDALGTTVEFRRRDSFPLHTEMTGDGAFSVKPGEWTDDTAMALCLAESLLACERFDSKDQLSRYVRWMDSGYMSCQENCIDIGNTTRDALRRFSRTQVSFAGTDNPFASGNGGIMRLAPAVIAAPDQKTAIGYAIDSSRTTHASADCLDSAELLGAVLWELRRGADLKVLLENLPDTQERGMAVGRIKNGFFRHFTRDEISSSGYVIDTLEAALWCCYHAESFEDAMITAVNLGDDADTVGAVTGQIAGAAWGMESIPVRWLEPLAWRERISGLAEGLAGMV
ncbi:ADP-ribosylglycohydrolase family protein [Marinobacter orientalis]|uniref:ADP-ribosylglycohydrolase family protein n=1 Tax=Marinobacter orientalis TaxID=1928859 RepID=A0A7Y0RC18_9GAMM|nr:ADP-ribosylglycohydrolase family protein [Marinobacter orientalis]NMT63463.1 ADP-ribosylglycohydrolase family protein [Marinobacter orientalis]TGX48524.1 ADP-ribosylglycohydrolase family protein [Marinobacter orientalis]